MQTCTSNTKKVIAPGLKVVAYRSKRNIHIEVFGFTDNEPIS